MLVFGGFCEDHLHQFLYLLLPCEEWSLPSTTLTTSMSTLTCLTIPESTGSNPCHGCMKNVQGKCSALRVLGAWQSEVKCNS